VAGGRVLVVDDEEGIRVLCKVNLELGGHQVIEAADGLEALEKARSQRPDLIFLDIMMPRMDGWEVLEKLKQDPATASIPVVLLTAKTGEQEQIRAWGEGIFDFIAKPFNPQSLSDWADEAMRPRDPAGEDARRQRAVQQLKLVQELRRGQ
jgi:CheY-like chemotaxis protein